MKSTKARTTLLLSKISTVRIDTLHLVTPGSKLLTKNNGKNFFSKLKSNLRFDRAVVFNQSAVAPLSALKISMGAANL